MSTRIWFKCSINRKEIRTHRVLIFEINQPVPHQIGCFKALCSPINTRSRTPLNSFHSVVGNYKHNNLIKLKTPWIYLSSGENKNVFFSELLAYLFCSLRENCMIGLIHIPNWKLWSHLIGCCDDACSSITLSNDWLQKWTRFYISINPGEPFF